MLRDYGIQVQEPAGWNSRFYKIVAPVVGPATIHAATVPLVDDDLSSYQTRTAGTLGADDVVLIAKIFDPEPQTASWSKPSRPTLTDFDFSVSDFVQMQNLPVDQIQARAVFVHAGRVAEVVACFGSSNPNVRALRAVVSSLRTLRIRPDAAKEPGGNAIEVKLPE